ncbi:hypothetical protein EYF80_030935 [Liparis tanakae]|uniref:Uncharacterized protein n=1 Tax=Liparis tanakae TaxID=230148 RepID=A0A4Z2H1W1_9TELE|nr:hypothetical protein EYF80_030935 [Liparis tanakae]
MAICASATAIGGLWAEKSRMGKQAVEEEEGGGLMVYAEPPPNSSISCVDISRKALLFMDFVRVLPKLEQFNLQYVTVHNGNVNEMWQKVDVAAVGQFGLGCWLIGKQSLADGAPIKVQQSWSLGEERAEAPSCGLLYWRIK